MSEFDANIWKNRPYFAPNYNGVSTPQTEVEELTRNAQTVRDALLGKPEDEWNNGTFGWHDCDYTDDQHALAWESTDVDQPLNIELVRDMLYQGFQLDRAYEQDTVSGSDTSLGSDR